MNFSFFVIDQFVMMSPFHLPFYLGSEVIMNGDRAVQTLRRSFTGHFKLIGAKPNKGAFHYNAMIAST